jgi:hypothetical protein
MEVILKRTVEGVGIYLPANEALKFLRDPERVQEAVSSMLRGGGLDPDTGKAIPSALDGAVPGVFGAARLDSGERKLLTPPGKKTHHKPTKPAKELLTCSLCGRGGFRGEGAVKIHMNYKHKEPSTPAPAGPEAEANAVPDPKADLEAEARAAALEDIAAEKARASDQGAAMAIDEFLDQEFGPE